MPPFKSNAQREKFRRLVKEGKMAQETFDKWEAETEGKLPERVPQKPSKTGVRRPRYVKGAKK